MSQSSDPTTYDPVAAGFKSGLEVHQQLLTDHKLFCRCPAGLYSDEYDAEALRHMRPTLSELGEYDGTALMEFKTRKEILYRLNRRSVCTYEMDDNPPFPINSQAVDIAIEIALLFNCKIVGELHVARKQYLDGSIPAGFQRTAIVGLNGGFEFQGRTIGVVQLAVEEDSCREILDRGHRRICATDRLSMPLIEVVTAPDIRTPEEVALVGTLIGDIVRSTGKVRRGIGSVRQDVNVSVAGGTRIEIKGVPRIPLFPSLTYYEAYRQSRLLALRERMRARGIDRLPRLFRRVDAGGRLVHPQVIAAVARGERVGATIATGMAGLLRWPIGPTRTFADDIAGRVRVIACLTEPPYILHTDDRRPTSLSRRDRETLKALGDMSEDDAAIVVHGQDADIDTALDEIEARIREALDGIPRETRRRLPGGETDFERILPGPDRMYPDTDSPPLEIVRERVEAIRERLPEDTGRRRARYEAMGLPEHWVRHLLRWNDRAVAFERAVHEGLPPRLAGSLVVELLTRRMRMKAEVELLSRDELESLLALVRVRKIGQLGARLLLEESGRRGSNYWGLLADRLGLMAATEEEVEAAIKMAIGSLSSVKSQSPEARTRYAMGVAMHPLRGRAAGSRVLARLMSSLGG